MANEHDAQPSTSQDSERREFLARAARIAVTAPAAATLLAAATASKANAYMPKRAILKHIETIIHTS